MKKVFFNVLAMMTAVHAAQALPRCFAYPVSPFEWRINGKTDPSLRGLAIYYLPDPGTIEGEHYMTMGYLDADGIGWNTHVICQNKADKGITSCGIECDGGVFDHNENFAIRVEALDLLRMDDDAQSNESKTLVARDPKAWISGYEFP